MEMKVVELKGGERTIVWYRATEQEARELADSNPSYVFLGKGYNNSFPDYWAVKVYDSK